MPAHVLGPVFRIPLLGDFLFKRGKKETEKETEREKKKQKKKKQKKSEEKEQGHGTHVERQGQGEVEGV